MRNRSTDDRGVALVGYALIAVLVAVASVGALKTVGQSTAASFELVGTSIAGDGGNVQPELTPLEKWEEAKADYTTTINDAKATRKSDLAAAKADYKDAVAANKSSNSMSKAEKKAANKQAKTSYNSTKKQIKNDYKATVASAKKARKDAKAEYKATR